ncbi:unnamed protein product, partial [Ectocarpus sp. 8 AP-2014]
MGQLACVHVTERRSAESRVRRPLCNTHHVVQRQTELPCFNAAHTFFPVHEDSFGDRSSSLLHFASFSVIRPAYYHVAAPLCTIRCTYVHVNPFTHNKHKDAIILVAVSRDFTNSKKATTPTHARLHIHMNAATHEKKRQLLHSEGFHQPSFLAKLLQYHGSCMLYPSSLLPFRLRTPPSPPPKTDRKTLASIPPPPPPPTSPTG